MREIKFRDWNKGGVMCYYREDNGDYECWGSEIEIINDILNYEDSNYIFMQYTGLKDVNDMEIYEGDIFHLGDNIKYVVKYEDCGLIGKQLGTNSYIGLTYWKDNIEILGNVYENPKLLEDK